MITGHLTPDNPLRAIFSDGIVPLSSPIPITAMLGDAKVTERAYLVAVAQLAAGQLEAMAQRMADVGQGSYAEALAHLKSDQGLPIRAINFSSVGIPLRAFL